MICTEPLSIAKALRRVTDDIQRASDRLFDGDPDDYNPGEDAAVDFVPTVDRCDTAVELLAEAAKRLVEQVGYIGQLREERRAVEYPKKAVKKTPPPSRRKKRTRKKG